ncbi:MAG: pyruvate dehydrogenase (acetyl-transferring), homodimeric type [Phycisphaerae bacterium]|jgi:pyruvate dehydrogenase E1 component
MSPMNHQDSDPLETAEWIASAESATRQSGTQRIEFLLEQLCRWARRRQIVFPFAPNTPYMNTIRAAEQPPFPGDREIERRIKSFVRWNAMAMVVRANRAADGIGGHISSYASAATLYEIGFNHFFRARTDDEPGDQIYIQGHTAPGVYARAFLEGRLDEQKLHNFRRELAPGGGLSSYPHPWLMPDFWEFPTVSMGLAPISSIYQARFNAYLTDRGLLDTSRSRVWCFLGDGETDEPESLGAITLAGREQLDNLTWVVNCNLQRLDGPVRGNGNIIQELEAAFRGAGWHVIKVIWGSDWDPLFAADADGALIEHMHEIVDGEWQRYTVESGAYAREHFFGRDLRLAKLVDHLTDEQIRNLRYGGHDPEKVYAAYAAATAHRGQPTVVLARTIKGYGLGEAGEGKNITHQQKKLSEEELRKFRDRFDIPVSDQQIDEAPFCRFPESSQEYEYLMARREALGGSLPHRRATSPVLPAPSPEVFAEFYKGGGATPAATTMAFMRMLARLLADPELGRLIVPIVPDEARTFGMDALFRRYGIYARTGQLYEPVDAHLLMRYEERKNGQILEEGITEAGSMASFTAAGSAYATHGVNTIPFFIFYSMFGFQRVADSIWAAADLRTRGFLVGGTAGRTTLTGEGLQHQDGQSQLVASTVPNCVSYDPAYAYELAVILHDGIRRMYEKQESIFYYLTVYNELYEQPPLPEDVNEGILRGMYKVRPAPDATGIPRVHLLGSGPLLREALRAQEILQSRFIVGSAVWSVTSYNELYRDAMATQRWNRLHPGEPQRTPYIRQQFDPEPWPAIATSDYVNALAERLCPWTPAGICSLGTEGFGRSDTRAALRRHFETDAEHIAYAALYELARRGAYPAERLGAALGELGLDPEAVDPARA